MRNWVKRGHRIFDLLAQLYLPTIAVLNGHAFGGGLELAAACDLRVMHPDAELALPEARVGIVPGWSGTQRLASQMPTAILKQMALLGCRLSAKRAYEIGFVNCLTTEPMRVAREMAEELEAQAATSIEISKLMIGAAKGEAPAAAIEALGGGI